MPSDGFAAPRKFIIQRMTSDKLEHLRKLAADPRTPEEEARTAALLYAKNAPPASSENVERLREQIRERDDRILELERERDAAKKDVEYHKKAATYFHATLKKFVEAREQEAKAKDAMSKATNEAVAAVREGIPVEEKGTRPKQQWWTPSSFYMPGDWK